MQTNHENLSGLDYFLKGLELIKTKGLRRFVIIPMSINLALFGAAFYYLVGHLSELFAWLESYIPDWLTWLNYLLWPLAVIFILVSFTFLFSTIANWIASPFNGLLSEKVELHLTGKPINDDGFIDLIKDTPRLIGREWTKLKYYLPRAIGFFILSMLIPVVGQVIWFLFSCWSMAIQYLDYPFDNHKIDFNRMKDALNDERMKSYSFGFGVTIFNMVPVVNLIVMPVAICGATAMWVDHFRQQHSADR